MWRGHLAPQGVCYEIDMPRAPGSPRQRWGGGAHTWAVLPASGGGLSPISQALGSSPF